MGTNLTQKLNSGIEELIARYEALLKENAEMAARLESCEHTITQNETLIKELKEKTDKLQLTAAFGNSSPDKGQAKRKVAQLIREIDRCIALLND